MAKYYGERSVNGIKNCAPFLKEMLENLANQPAYTGETGWNSQIVDQATNRVWVASIEVGTGDSYNSPDDYAANIPSADAAAQNSYTAYVEHEFNHTTIRAQIAMACIGSTKKEIPGMSVWEAIKYNIVNEVPERFKS
ncbi:hypothetical protein FQ192_17400 [Pseudomonas sp. ANT_J12]|uniref:hypothetical protein n=1 Tax=Pseudomonas sp. ANT_J12 TaxID=2597351 RepID=UPI0011F0BA18|nr:hypothetical protein [Pseudomonas sp. ANT_J12]KAA0988248.1 hypothetical protein FQ192_17400 [Pseudomonas sp. ANT_J12]